MKKPGYIILHIGTYLIILGGLGDIGYTFLVTGIIPAHMDYLKITEQEISAELQNLDLGFMRAIGGLLVASGTGALIILNGQVKNGNKPALLGVLFMMTIGEGNNALQMYLVDSPFFAIPLSFLVLIWIGGLLCISTPELKDK